MNYLKVRKWYADAEKNSYAIGAFNFCNSDIANAIFNAAKKLNSPVIIATSSGEMMHIGAHVARGVIDGLNKMHGEHAILHLDHGKRYDDIAAAINAGYDSVHCDGSSLSFADNLKLTRKCAALAHRNGKWIEGELGHVGGSSTLHKNISYSELEMVMTDPKQAERFVRKTGINSLAINIGNVHGVWKGRPALDFNRLEAIKRAANIPLVLHGGSGIPASLIKKALARGIDKINVNTEIRVAYSSSLRKSLSDQEMFIPTTYLPFAVASVQKIVEKKILFFGSRDSLG